MINTPLIEIELQPTAPASCLSAGQFKKQIAPRTNRFQFVDRDLLSPSRTSPPDQLALLCFKKTIQQYDQYGCDV